MVRRGVLSRSIGGVVTLVPPLTTTEQEIQTVMEVLRSALLEIAV
jgi:adenosylmethionine-8-amino-7-oxononanoate aminotransferase